MWLSQLDEIQRRAVLDLAARAQAADRADPLNEEARLSVSGEGAEHLVASESSATVGYLNWHPVHRTAQVVVDPAHRRRGIGRALVTALAERTGTVRLWSFGDPPEARGFASALGLRPVRELLIMERTLEAAAAMPDRALQGVRLTAFDAATDTGAVLALNAEAFADHPEQGGLTLAGFQARTAEPWFDPDGLILAFDAEGLAGFHWTKRHDAHTGEVYVIAVAPRAQGLGVGWTLLEAGLARMAAIGCRRAVLYVDSAEARAVRMYRRAGFAVAHRHVLYASDPEETS